jgi:histone H3/H4
MAVEAMREASECLLTSIFEDAYLLALHAKRVTLFPRDMALLLNLRHDMLSKSVNGD